MNNLRRGDGITQAFEFIQKVCVECAQIIHKTDSELEQDWKNPYGNMVTRDGSASLQFPEKWIVQKIFRVYENRENMQIRKGITITFWETNISEPVITAGKILYRKPDSNRTHWDLWNLWQNGLTDQNEKRDDLTGTLYRLSSTDNIDIDTAEWFSCRLVDISDETALESKIIVPLKKL